MISKSHKQLVAALSAVGFGLTLVDGRGGRGSEVGVVFSVCHRNRLQELLEIVRQVDRSAIVTVQEVREQVHGFFSRKRPAPPATRAARADPSEAESEHSVRRRFRVCLSGRGIRRGA